MILYLNRRTPLTLPFSSQGSRLGLLMEKAREALLCNIQDHLAMTTVVLIRRGQPYSRMFKYAIGNLAVWEWGQSGMGAVWEWEQSGMETIWNGDNLEWGQSRPVDAQVIELPKLPV